MINREKVSIYTNIEGFFHEHLILATMDKNDRVNLMPLTFKSVGNILGEICINIFVSNNRYSCSLLENGIQEFTLSRGNGITQYIEKTGNSSGRNINKIKEYNIPLLNGMETKVPVLADATESYECELIGSVEKSEFLGYKMFIGSIKGVYLHYKNS
ncbi:MAG: hypothetical protein JJT78_08905 [Leptospira sp.]|nr:hypothetical protein [Leptospira sp.]